MKLFAMVALMAAGASFAQNTPNAAIPTVWNLATGYRAESFHGKNLGEFALAVDKATAGRLKIELHTNNSLAKLNDIRAAVQEGRAQAGDTTISSLVKEIPSAGADFVPFVVASFWVQIQWTCRWWMWPQRWPKGAWTT